MTDTSKFERELGLKPMGEDVLARMERLENLLGLFLRANIPEVAGTEMHKANVHSPSYSSHITLPLPAETEIVSALDKFRTPKARAAQKAREEADAAYTFWESIE